VGVEHGGGESPKGEESGDLKGGGRGGRNEDKRKSETQNIIRERTKE